MFSLLLGKKARHDTIRRRRPSWKPTLQVLEDRCLPSGYQFTTIDVPGADSTQALGINNAGQIVGTYLRTGSHGFVRSSAGQFTPIDVPGSFATVASGINNAGEIVGFYADRDRRHGFLLSGGHFTVIDPPDSIWGSEAYGINDAGEIVGEYHDAHDRGHGFLLSGEQFTTIDVPGAQEPQAIGINDASQIVGNYIGADLRSHGFLLSDGHFTTIDVPNSFDTSANGINDAAQIVGGSDHLFFGPSGFLLSDGHFTPIDVPGFSSYTVAWGINNGGQIVGWYDEPPHGFVASPLDIVVDSVRTDDSRSVTVEYDVTSAVGSQPFDIGIFRSPTQEFHRDNSRELGRLNVSADDVTIGHHSKPITLSGGIPIDTSFRYVVAAADPDGQLSGVNIDNRAFFKTYVIGAVSVGFDIRSRWSSSPPEWVDNMADTLANLGYDAKVPFHWDSAEQTPGLAESAGYDLSQLILKEVDGLPNLRENDVIDLHLIGHSRGSVVISQSVDWLLLANVPQLQHGYLKMTLLDPHPANNDYGLNASFSPDVIGSLLFLLYFNFQDAVNDSPVVVPSRVNEAEIFWQKTSYSDLSGLEAPANLWGLDPANVRIRDPHQTRISTQDLTGRDWGDGKIGHSEVHEFYQALLDGGHRPPGPGNRRSDRPFSAPALFDRRSLELPTGDISPTRVEVGQAQVPGLKPDYLDAFFTVPMVGSPNPVPWLGMDAGMELRVRTRHMPNDSWLEPLEKFILTGS